MTLRVKLSDRTIIFGDVVKSQSGVYLATTETSDGSHNILYAGESGDIKERLGSHEKESCWERNKVNGVYIFTYYCNKAERESLEGQIRRELNPVCND